MLTEACDKTSNTSWANIPDKVGIFSNYSERYHGTESLMGLDYGREKDSNGNYICNDLDTINGLLHKEYASVWRNSEDSTCFNMCIGVYLDTIFPSIAVKRIMLEKVDSAMTEGMRYDLPKDELISLKSQKLHPESIQNFLKVWGWNFERWTKVYNFKAADIKCNQILDSRGCVVCHKIYEDPRWATYILESSVDYHGSCGCNSSANYITIDKHSGQILAKEDVLSEPSIYGIFEKLPLEYMDAASKKGVTPNSGWDKNGKELFNKSDGVALLNEGLLVYFAPYSIGCGAE